MKPKIITILCLLAFVITMLGCIQNAPEPQTTSTTVEPITTETTSVLETTVPEENLTQIKNDFEPQKEITYTLLGKETLMLRINNTINRIRLKEILTDESAILLINDKSKQLLLNKTVISNNIQVRLLDINYGLPFPTGEDQVSFYYATGDGIVKDMIKEGQTKKYITKNKKIITIKVKTISDSDPRVIFEINGVKTRTLREKEQQTFNDKTSIFVSRIYPNEAGEVKTRNAVKVSVKPLY